MKVIQHLDRDDYELVGVDSENSIMEFTVWSAITNRSYYGTSLEQARSNRDSAERVKRDHQLKGND